MPLSFGLPLGLIVLAAGAIMLFATEHKTAARIILGIGAAVTLLTLIVILLAVNSNMVFDLRPNMVMHGDRRTIPFQPGPSNQTANGSRIAGA